MFFFIYYKNSFQLYQNMGAHKKSASWESSKWVKGNEHRRRRRAKVGVNNGQHKRLNQNTRKSGFVKKL